MKKKITEQPLTEMEAYQLALSKVNLREAVAPLFRGKIVEDEDTYNKVHQLLDCPKMEHAHKFLLDVDFEDITDDVKQKVDELYQLAVSQGFIEGSQEEAEEDEVANEVGKEAADIAQSEISDNSGGFEKESVSDSSVAASKDSIQTAAPELNSCAFVLFYSAMKHGEIKTGECYSNATTMENAKIDAIQKLKKLGFSSIDIIAAEECDPNARGCDSRQPDSFGEKTYEPIEKSDPKPVEDVKDAVPSAQAKKEADNAKEDSEDEDKPEEKEDKESEEDKAEEEKPADDKEEKEEEPEEEEPAEKEMSRSEKVEMFKEYLNEFKQLLQKMKSECYSEMSLADRAKFYDEMSKIWKDKPDPMTFMTDDNVDQIEHMRIKIAK